MDWGTCLYQSGLSLRHSVPHNWKEVSGCFTLSSLSPLERFCWVKTICKETTRESDPTVFSFIWLLFWTRALYVAMHHYIVPAASKLFSFHSAQGHSWQCSNRTAALKCCNIINETRDISWNSCNFCNTQDSRNIQTNKHTSATKKIIRLSWGCGYAP